MKREAQSFYDDFFIRPKPGTAPATKPWRAPKGNTLLRTLKLHPLTFLKSPKSSAHTSGAWRHSHPAVTFLSGVSILTSLNDTSAPRAREHLRSCLHLTNPRAKRKVLSLTKQKDKIYKTKSLGHYITILARTYVVIVTGQSTGRRVFKSCTESFAFHITLIERHEWIHVNPCRDSQCQEVRESRSLYAYICIFILLRVFFSCFFFYWRKNNF